MQRRHMARNSRKGAGGGAEKPKAYHLALNQLKAHPLLGKVAEAITWQPALHSKFVAMEKRVLCRMGHRAVYFNEEAKLSELQWLGTFAISALVFAVGGAEQDDLPSVDVDCAAQLAAMYWWKQWRIGSLPEQLEIPDEVIAWGRFALPEIRERWRTETLARTVGTDWLLTCGAPNRMIFEREKTDRVNSGNYGTSTSIREVFAASLAEAAKRALALQKDGATSRKSGVVPDSNADRAKRWLITHYPLFGSLLAQFEIIEDAEICRRMDIGIAAIWVNLGEIYLNPVRLLTIEQSKFVLAHEVLHAGLCHSARRRGRDAYLWNVACDFVINDWLVQMQIGQPPPQLGLLYDEELRGLAAEEIYLRLASDLRIRKRLCTMRGNDVDILDERGLLRDGTFSDREEFYRRALAQGLDFHQSYGRGTVPAGMEEAIRTLEQPVIPWQAQLAEWIRERVPLPERVRTYARPSRRQSATPEYPRPRFFEPSEQSPTHTFGVIIDTSGSMERDDLGNALGAIVSYARQQKVRAVRLIYCDAAAYDEGFVDIETLAHRVRVRGRGGTVLQSAVSLLATRTDFPKDCSVLVITDGMFEETLAVSFDHAFLLPPGRHLPFRTHQPVFYMNA
jgi:predicted metal-dependent peptidase